MPPHTCQAVRHAVAWHRDPPARRARARAARVVKNARAILTNRVSRDYVCFRFPQFYEMRKGNVAVKKPVKKVAKKAPAKKAVKKAVKKVVRKVAKKPARKK